MALSEKLFPRPKGLIGGVDSYAAPAQAFSPEASLEQIIPRQPTAWELTVRAAATGCIKDIIKARARARREGKLSSLRTTIVLFNAERPER